MADSVMDKSSSLTFRTPVTTWNITAVFFALVLHGTLWFGANLLLGNQQAVPEAQRQMTFALAWMVGILAMWRIALPSSRWHAVGMVMMGAIFVSVLGNIGALIIYVFSGARIDGGFLSAFTIYRGLSVVAEIVLAVPSAVLLQMLALKRSVPA